MTACPTCHQELPGPEEPDQVGAIVTCACGDVLMKLPSTDRRGPQWQAVTAAKKGNRVARLRWVTVLDRHRGDGHGLTVLRNSESG